MPEIKLNFAAGLAYLLKRNHVSQANLARDLGLDPQVITDYKKGRRKGDEIERNQITGRMGMPEHLVRKLGMMIRSGVPEDEAYERVTNQNAAAAHTDEIARFNRALDNFFDQIREFLRDKYGETMHTAIVFEQTMLKVMPRFCDWKRELTIDLLEPDAPSLAEPSPQYVVAQAQTPPQDIV